MRYFSQNSITHSMFRFINLALTKRAPIIPISRLNDTTYHIVPVLVLSSTESIFHCHFMSNPYYKIDLDVLDGSLFRHVYLANGEYDHVSSSRRITQYTARCHEHIRYDIYMPNVLKAGDILLCDRGAGCPP